MESVYSFAECRAIVEREARRALAQPPLSERVALAKANGRVLGKPLLCDRDLPPFDRSTRDGFAVRAADTGAGRVLRIAGSVRAGQAFAGQLLAGECVEIMTGAPVPGGADAVLMVEHTAREADRITAARSVESGENVVPRGSEAKAGDRLLSPGTRLDYAAIGLCASVGAGSVEVFARPRVGILSTGDEIVEVGQAPGASQIRNSNAYSLAAQVEAAGGDSIVLPVAPDEPSRLSQLIAQGMENDLLVITGGVSMGAYDLVESELAKVGAQFFFTGAKIQPGKPVVFGRAQSYFFGLPGNPVSTMVTFELFVRPLLDALGGAPPAELRIGAARLTSEIKTKTGLTRFLPAILTVAPEATHAPEVAPVRWQGSGDLVATARANAWLIVPPDRDRLESGELVNVLLR